MTPLLVVIATIAALLTLGFVWIPAEIVVGSFIALGHRDPSRKDLYNQSQM